MYYASLLFCVMTMGQPVCLIADDTYSPHDTMKACEQRLVEMSKALLTELPYVTIEQTKCEPKHYTMTSDVYGYRGVGVYLR